MEIITGVHLKRVNITMSAMVLKPLILEASGGNDFCEIEQSLTFIFR